jgi:hypothetical protein
MEGLLGRSGVFFSHLFFVSWLRTLEGVALALCVIA